MRLLTILCFWVVTVDFNIIWRNNYEFIGRAKPREAYQQRADLVPTKINGDVDM